MESDKKLLVSKGDMIFWIWIFAAMGFFVGMFVSAGFDLDRLSSKIDRVNAEIEATDERIKEYEQDQKWLEELLRKINETPTQ